MGLELLTWPEALLQGGAGLIGFLLVFLAARWRWRGREDDGGQADIGLD